MILHVEDNVCDALLLKLSFRRLQVPCRIHNVNSARAAVDYLAGNGEYANRQQWPLPKVVLLDLNMPCLGGFEVLSWLRQQGHLRTLPVVILTSSGADADRALARELGATAYLEKTADYQDVAILVQTLTGNTVPDHDTARILAHGRSVPELAGARAAAAS